MSATDRNNHYEAQFVATQRVQPRTLFQKHGKAYQVCGEDVILPGELVVGHNNRRTEIEKGNEGDEFAEDADVFYATSGYAYLDLAAATAASEAFEAGTVGFRAGKASKLSGPTENTVMVHLNF